jgi:hypothetical protein
MSNVVEQTTDVVLENPVALPAALAGHRECVMGGFARAVPVGVGVKYRLQQRFQHQNHRRLGDPITHGGYPQDPCPSRFLRNRHRLDGRREVGPRRQPIPDPVEAPVTVPIELRERDRIDSGRSSIGLHPLVCLPHQPFRNRKRFRRHRRLILRRELATDATGTTRPLCSAPITGASSLVRVGPSSVRASVLCASLFFTWQAPLTSRPRVPAVPPKRLNRARAISMPDTAHPVGRLPMGSSQR